jgi:hypothetical protein
MSDADYHRGYFEGVRAVFLMWQKNLIQYEADEVVELQLQSEKFFKELNEELKVALRISNDAAILERARADVAYGLLQKYHEEGDA